MGVYLSSPITEKTSSDQKCKKFTYGASSMQGWRMSQEDAHNCVPEFEEDTSLFAVYDGHGGAEVAQYCALHLPDYIRQTSAYHDGRLDQGLQDAFLGFDETLTEPHIIRDLKLMAGVEEEAEDKEAGVVPASQTERDMLLAEANMPLEDVLAQYDGAPPPKSKLLHLKANKQQFQSPMLKSKGPTTLDGPGGDPGGTVTSEADSTKSGPSEEVPSARVSLDSKLANGHADNDNNLNTEKEISQSSSISSVSIVVHDECGKEVTEREAVCSNGDAVRKKGSQEEDEKLSSPTSTTDSGGERSAQPAAPTIEATSQNQLKLESQPSSSSTVGEPGSSSSNQSIDPESSNQNKDPVPPPSVDSTQPGSSVSSETEKQSPSSSTEKPECGSSCSVNPDTGRDCEAASSSEADAGPSLGPGSSSAPDPLPGGSTTEVVEAGSSSGILDLDDSDDSEDSEADYEGGSSSEEAEMSEESEEEEEGELQEIDGMLSPDSGLDKHTEEPGSDSGCTAVVAVIKGRQLVVANAGDSRCVLCRDGKAVDLSFDHKPEDEPEQARIEAAGGKVTMDGRVNGGLNLSRAIGDHFYKRNGDLPAKDQMITAYPDVQSTTIGREDEFIVLACDGIWNYMNSQEVVDFVRKRLATPEYRETPSKICEEMFDHCLAPNTVGDGTGCDNMTCILVLLAEEFRAAGPYVAELEPVRSEPLCPVKRADTAEPSAVREEDVVSSGVKRSADELEDGPDDCDVEDGRAKKVCLSELSGDGDVADSVKNTHENCSMDTADSTDVKNGCDLSASGSVGSPGDSHVTSQTVDSSTVSSADTKSDLLT